jgi:hypothetical protein
MLPQAWIAKGLLKVKNRLLPWYLGMALQLFATLTMFLSALFLEGLNAGIAIMLGLIVLSVSRSLSSLTMKDIQATHVQKGSRGRLIGAASSISALITVSLAIVAMLHSQKLGGALLGMSEDNMSSAKILFIGATAIIMQGVCMIFMLNLKTHVVAPAVSKEVLALNASLKKFITVRALLSHTALVAPLFTIAYTGNALQILGLLIIAQAGAEMSSSYIWGTLSDKSAKLTMQLGAGTALLASLILLLSSVFFNDLLSNKWIIVSLFFILSIGHSGVRTARKIYAVDIAEDHKRTEFVATANTYVGLFMLVIGSVYALLMALSADLTLFVMASFILLGLVLSNTLKSEK